MRPPWAEPVRLELEEGLWPEEGRLDLVGGLVELGKGRLEDEGGRLKAGRFEVRGRFEVGR